MPDRIRPDETETEHAAHNRADQRSDHWKKGYDEAVREGPALADIPRGEYAPRPDDDWLAGAGVHGYGPPDTSQHWGSGTFPRDVRGYAPGDDARPDAASGAAPDSRSPDSWGRLGGWRHAGSGAGRPRGPKGYRRSDSRIREDLCEHLMNIAHIDSSEVYVEVKDACVTLEGTVPQRGMKHEIEDIAAATLGVTDVENRIRVPRRAEENG